jgi:Kdo2-lipid IVA lauroyltransferase/acyltransferase
MGAVAYYILYSLNWCLTLLPLPVLYLLSDLVFLYLYYFPSYRRKVVITNLRNAFPEKSEKELAVIEKKFYRHLADLFPETLKLTHMSSGQLMKRMRVTNPEVLDRLYRENRDILAVMGHYGNWEWLQSTIFYTRHQTVSIYKPLNNKRADDFVRKLREKKGMILTPMSNIIREIIRLRSMGIKALYGFIADQTPPKGEIRYWTTFLNQDTAVYHGLEKVASKYDMAVVYFRVRKERRGYYSTTAEVLFEHSVGLPEHVITESHVRRLEETIMENPEYWIWSHRRWKHKKPAGE